MSIAFNGQIPTFQALGMKGALRGTFLGMSFPALRPPFTGT